MCKEASFNCDRNNFDALIKSLKFFLEGEGYNIREFNAKDYLVFEVDRSSKLRSFFGMSVYETIKIDFFDDSLIVRFRNGRWGGKIISGAVGWLIFWPWAVTSAVGVYKQYHFADNVISFLDLATRKMRNS